MSDKKMLSKKLKNGEKIKVGIFMGGPSSEREISLESGRHIYNSLDASKYEKVPVFVDKELKLWQINEALLWLNTTEDISNELESQGAVNIEYQQIPEFMEFAFLGLHGKFVEDGSLQGLLELLNVPYNGPGVLGAAIGMDKYYQRKLLKGAGFRVPDHMPIEADNWENDSNSVLEKVEQKFEYPVVVKPSREGCSTAVAKVEDRSSLEEAIVDALNWDNLVLVEEYIDAQEITCTIIGNEEPIALTPTETPKKTSVLSVEEKFLPGDASMITPPEDWDEEMVKSAQEQFVKAYKTLELSVYSRIDAFWKDGEIIVLEPNTLPGVTPSTMVFHQAAEADMSPAQFFDKVIEYAIEAHEEKTGPR